MAAIDPSAEPETDGEANVVPRATLKLIRQPIGPEDEESENSDDEEYMKALLAEADSDEESDEEDEAGPSDPSKSKKARKQAAIEELMKSIDTGSDDDMEDAPSGKGKAKSSGDDDDEEEDSDDDEDLEVEEFVICTLDPAKVRNLKTCRPIIC